MPFRSSPCLGVDLTAASSANPSNKDSGHAHRLGDAVDSTRGQRWMFVHASAAVAQYDVVAIDENFGAKTATKARADDNFTPGFAQFAFAAKERGFVALCGSSIKAKVAASCNVDAALYTSSTAGVLDDASTGHTKLEGVVAVAANNSATAVAVEVQAVNPRFTV